jgi:phosphomevalonate kinase
VELANAVFEPALEAHARAQGGGSGVDIAAAAFGGTLTFRRAGGVKVAMNEPPVVGTVELPPALTLEAWWSGVPAVTSELVTRVAELGRTDPACHARILEGQAAASERAAVAFGTGNAAELVAAFSAQRSALRSLGTAAGVAIVTLACEELGIEAERTGGTVWPAGAGGGDVVLYAGPGPSSGAFREVAGARGHRLLGLSLGARGVHPWFEGGKRERPA